MAKVYWTMTTDTFRRYTELREEMMTAAQHENKLAFEMAKDAFRALPGFPSQMNPDTDLAVPVIRDLVGTVYSIGGGK